MTLAANTSGPGSYHGDFRLSITKALGDQLAAALSDLRPAPLTQESLECLEDRPGVYQLYLHGQFVYVGKADRSLPTRLGNHLRKISGRRDISLGDVKFSCLYVAEDFSALAPEQLLINHHKGLGGIPWNGNGFGQKDPGRQRDTTILKASHFDVLYPINLDVMVEGLTPGGTTLTAFLKRLKEVLPYNFRYAEPPAQVARTPINVPDAGLSADRAFQLVSASLPAAWQITALMGYVIMYGENKEYQSAWRYYRSGVTVEATPVWTTAEATDIDTLDIDT